MNRCQKQKNCFNFFNSFYKPRCLLFTFFWIICQSSFCFMRCNNYIIPRRKPLLWYIWQMRNAFRKSWLESIALFSYKMVFKFLFNGKRLFRKKIKIRKTCYEHRYFIEFCTLCNNKFLKQMTIKTCCKLSINLLQSWKNRSQQSSRKRWTEEHGLPGEGERAGGLWHEPQRPRQAHQRLQSGHIGTRDRKVIIVVIGSLLWL